ncbi:MAG: peptidyl-prolyl cis-trans isomerase [Bacteroidetes bacterium]|nr:peptidyl-prolyl cis-trans isomerase [Bacteroidota bacterium]
MSSIILQNMLLNKFKTICILGVVFSVTGFTAMAYAQSGTILARAGNSLITAEEFINRWELSPQQGRKQDGLMSESRKKLYYTLISEKLLGQYGEERQIDTTWVFRRLMKSTEEIYVRDALFKQEIDSKVKPSKKMEADALRKSSVNLITRFIFTPSADSAKFLYNKLSKGVSFDSLLQTRPEWEEQVKPVEVTYGTMEVEVENALFALKQGGISKPISRENGFFIFKLLRIDQKPPVSERESGVFEKKIRDMVHVREMDRLYLVFMKSFFKDKTVSTDRTLFNSLASKMADILSRYVGDQNPKKIAPVGVSDLDIQRMEQEFGPDSLKMIFIKYKENPVTLRDFLYDMQFRGFAVSTRNKEKIIGEFASLVKIMSRDAVLNAEGYRRKLNLLPEITSRLQEFKLHHLSERVKGRVADTLSVSLDEAKSYYQNFYAKSVDSVLINVQEIQVKSAEKAADILTNIKLGDSFDLLFEKFHENEFNKNRNGISGLFYPSQRGDIGSALLKLEPGEVYGPVNSGKFYSIFKLIEKKKLGYLEARPIKPFDAVEQQMKQQALEAKYIKGLSKLTNYCAEKYGLEMNPEELDKLSLTTVNMAGFQEMGFGGKVLAVPYTSEFTEWVKDLNQKGVPAP